ncbi:MAG: tetratricopeptide repeat protein [Methanothrix sp.]|nr:tetratricopeptide repeat protein [Methanothrix sp.]
MFNHIHARFYEFDNSRSSFKPNCAIIADGNTSKFEGALRMLGIPLSIAIIVLILLLVSPIKLVKFSRRIFLIGVLHYAVRLSELIVRVRRIFDGWRRPLFRLAILSLLLFGLLILILPLDPLNLEETADGFNKSSVPGPIFDRLFADNEIDVNSQDDFANIFSSWPTFSILLSDEEILNKSLSNQSNLEVVLLRADSMPPLSDWVLFNQTFADRDVFKKIFLNETIYRGAIDNNGDKSNRSIIIEQTFFELKSRTLALRKAYDNSSLQSICYIEAAKDKGVKKQLIDSIRQNISGKTNAIETLQRISKEVLNQIYIDPSAKSEAFLLLATDSTLRYYISKSEHPLIYLFLAYIWSYWQTIIALWLLIEIALWLRRSSRGIEVADFSDDTKDFDASKKEIYEGLGAILLQKLVSMARLYQTVDEGRPIGTVSGSGVPIPAVIKAEDTSQLTSGVFSEDSKISIGGFTISASFINSMINWLSKKPKINGSIYQENSKLILTATLNSDKSSRSWRVDFSLKPVEDGTQDKTRLEIDQMASELAYRIFSDLAFGENKITPWKAMKYFNEGLRSYRDCLHGASDRKLKLQEAISRFENVLTWDEDFPWAHYNLGVAYSEIGNLPSAKAAFEKAVHYHPDSGLCYYALALNMYDSDLHKTQGNCEVIWFCRKAIALKSKFQDKAKIFDLMALAWPKNDRHRDECVEDCLFRASSFSLLALLSSVLRGKSVENARNVTVKCLDDLAREIFEKKHNTSAKWLLGWSLKLSPYDRNLNLDLADVYLSNNKWEKALDRISCSADPSSMKYWATLISIHNEGKDNKYFPLDTKLKKKVVDRLLNRFSVASSNEILNVRDALIDSEECLEPLYLIKLQYEKSINITTWPWPPDLRHFVKNNYEKYVEALKNESDLKIWAKANDALTKNDENAIKESILEIKRINDELKNSKYSQIVLKTASDEIKYAHILKILGTLYGFSDRRKGRSGHSFVFSWDELLGNDSVRRSLLKFLAGKYGIDWIKTAEITKLDSDKTIKVSVEEKSILLKINDEKTELILEIYDGRTDKFIAENGKLKIYELSNYEKDLFKLFRFIMKNVLKKSEHELPDEYEMFRETLIDEWNISITPRDRDKERIEVLIRESPLVSIHRMNLGTYYRDELQNYKQARIELECAILLEPDNPRIRSEIGRTYYKEMEYLKGSDKENAFNEAEKCFRQADDLFADGINKIKNLYYIGLLYRPYKNYYPKMVLEWKRAKSIAEHEGLDMREALLISYNLVVAYLENKRYNECEKEASRLIKKLEMGQKSESVGSRIDYNYRKGTLAVLTRLNLALSYIERDIKLDDASLIINEAFDIMSKDVNIDSDYKPQLSMAYYDRRGWLEYKRYKNKDPSHEVFDGQDLFLFQTLISPIKRKSHIQITKAILSAPEGMRFAGVTRKDGKIILKDAVINDVVIPELKIDNAKFVNVVINKAIIKKAEIDNSTTIVYDEIKDGIIKSEDNQSITKKLGDIPEDVKGIEKATILKSSIAKFEVEKIDIKSAEISFSAPESIDKAIDYLERSIEFEAFPLPYLHLATAYEAKMRAERDADQKSFLREIALAACDHLQELDENKIYSDDLDKLRQRLEKKDDAEEKEAKKDSTSIVMKIEGTAKGELVAPPKD